MARAAARPSPLLLARFLPASQRLRLLGGAHSFLWLFGASDSGAQAMYAYSSRSFSLFVVNNLASCVCFCAAGRGKLESTLGHVAVARSSETPRSLRVCKGALLQGLYHSLDAPCAAPARLVEFVGFVH